MKRLLLLISLSLLGAPLAMATTDYINYGVVSVVCPPGVPPQIDASNFVNYGTFQITNLNVDPLYYYLPPDPYETWNTRNYTNFNRILGDSGYKFDYFDSVGQTNGWSANFQNAGNVNETNAYVFGATYVQVAATNIVNKGSLSVSGPGVLTLTGKTVDLTRGTLGGRAMRRTTLRIHWTGIGTLASSASTATCLIRSLSRTISTPQPNSFRRLNTCRIRPTMRISFNL